jgi:hypothetical protein
MVGVGDDEEAAQEADGVLDGFGADLAAALISDAELGGELDGEAGEFRLPHFVTDKDPPFGEYEDGTRGRLLVFELRLATAIEEPE